MQMRGKILNKADEELLSILKDTFLTKKDSFYSQDEYAKAWILRALLATLVFSVSIKTLLALFGQDVSEFPPVASTVGTIFFGFLFLHINSKSENFSVIVFVLTFVSMVVGFYG